MKYTKKAFDKAEETLSARRKKAEDERNQRVMEIQVTAPEIAAMNKSMQYMNCEMLKVIGGKNKVENTHEIIENIKEKNMMTRDTIRELLLTCGYPEDYLQYHPFCEKCKDWGYVEGVRCDCFEKLLSKYTTDELNENCMISLHDFNDFRIDYYPTGNGAMSPKVKMSEIFEYCKRYTENFTEHSNSLFFFGKTGLGKTFLSSCIANQLLKEGRNVVFGSILNLFRKIENEHFGRAEGNTTDILINAELVILDDLGSEFQTTFTDSVLYEIINERLNLNKPTIVSTNLSMKELNTKYNERIVSRLTGCFVPIFFIGDDIRHTMRKLGTFNE